MSLVLPPTTCRVSSVLDRNKTLYGAHHMLSMDKTTCWNSAQGSPQQILLQFNRTVTIHCVEMMFQGGFVGQDIQIQVRSSGCNEWKLLSDVDIEPNDSNELQQFSCTIPHITALQLCFQRSTDFYGRVILYRLDVQGVEEYNG